MFTGIVQQMGVVSALERRGADLNLRIATKDGFLADTALGDSICVSGVCVTVTALEDERFSADLSVETLDCTTLGRLQTGQAVNLESALRAGDPLGGHLVTGHVDCVGRLVKRVPDARSERLWFELPESLARLVAAKGSVCVDGVSLTVNGISGRHFDVNLIPHTLASTTLGGLDAGDAVNVEVDILARYAARWAQTEPGADRE